VTDDDYCLVESPDFDAKTSPQRLMRKKTATGAFSKIFSRIDSPLWKNVFVNFTVGRS
jgi:hypothetical protein